MTAGLGISSIYNGLRHVRGSELSHSPKSLYARFGKRMLDVSVVGICAPVAIPCVVALFFGTRIFAANSFGMETRIGRNGDGFQVLRSTTIGRGDWGGMADLPLLWNVLKGDLSLVGPRPMTRREAHAHCGLSYYHLRPGLIDPCIEGDTNALSPSAQAGKNAEYLINQSLFGDLLAIWKRCLR